MAQHLDVFVSSTSKDLPEHRRMVKETIIDLGLYPIMMENFAAEGATAVTRCKRGVAEAEIFIGIYAHRYGWMPGTDQGGDETSSITALEYQWARERGIPVLCFVIDPRHPWPPGPPHFDEEHDKTIKLKRFKERVMGEAIVREFTTPDNLARQVATSLSDAVTRLTGVAPQPGGWRRPAIAPLDHNFVGRAGDVRDLTALLTAPGSAPVTVVSGGGGIGKTFLAQHLARALDDAFAGGALWVSFGPEARHAGTVVPRVLADWAACHPDGRKIPFDQLSVERVRALLEDAPGRLIAVFDDVWYPGPMAALRKALPANAAVLVTTRSVRVAGASGVQAYPLHKLPHPDGLALLEDRLTTAGDDPAPARAHLAEIVRLLDGHALALDLSARQLIERGIDFAPRFVERLARNLREETRPFQLLELGDQRDDSLAAALDLSYETLRDDEPAKFRALGVIAPDATFSARTAFAVWGVDTGDEDARDAAEDALHALVRAGLLRHDRDTARYSQHMLLRVYAAAMAREAGEHDPALGRYSRHVIFDIAEQFHDLPPEQWDAAILVDEDHIHYLGDSLAGTENPQNARDVGYIQSIVLGETPLAALAAPLPPENLDELRAASPPRPPSPHSGEGGGSDMIAALVERGSDFAAAVYWYVFRRRVAEGRRWLAMALACARLQGDRGRESLFMGTLASWYGQRGQPRVELAYQEASAAIYHELGNKKAEATTLNNIGGVYHALGEPDKALDFYQQALPIRRDVGDRAGEAATLNNIGLVYRALGEPDKALDFYQQALPIRRDVGDRAGEAATLFGLAAIYSDQEDPDRAAETLRQIIEIYHAIGAIAEEAAALGWLSNVLHRGLDRTAEAIPLRERAVSLLESRNLPQDAAGQTVAFHRARLAELRRALESGGG